MLRDHLRKVYYGWWITICLLISATVVFGIGIYAFTLFVNPLAEEFGWSRTALGGVVSIFWIAAPLAPVIGLLIERYGVKRMMLTGAVIEGLCLILIYSVTSLWQLYLLRALMGLGKITIAVSIPIAGSYWFSKRLGTAIAIAWAGVHLGGVIWPPVTQAIIDAYGWRVASLGLGATIIILVSTALHFGYRYEKPSELGLLPDGAPLSGSKESALESSTTSSVDHDKITPAGLTFRQAVKTKTFWLIVSASMLFYFGYAGVIVHQVALLTDQGVGSQAAANMLGLTEAMAIVGVLSVGFLIDRWHSKAVGSVLMLMIVVAMLSLLSASFSPGVLIYGLFILTFGLAAGGGDVFWITFLKHCFGSRQFERIYSSWYVGSLAILFTGPMIVGYFFDTYGSYNQAIVAILVAAAIAFFLLARTNVPARAINQGRNFSPQDKT